MKKYLLFFVLLSLSAGYLWSVQVPMFSAPDMKQASPLASICSFVFVDNQVMMLDKDKSTVSIYNPQSKSFEQIVPETWKSIQKPVDITYDGKNIYILEAEKSQIITYDIKGKLLRSFTTAAVAEAEFKNPYSLIVNYIGTIYVLDKGRSQILSFTNEGLFLRAYDCVSPISMSLGADQEIRLLSYVNNVYQIDILGTDLEVRNTLFLNKIGASKGDITDISVNNFNEIYLVNSSQCQISKIDETGKIIPTSQFGSKAKKPSMGAFGEPGMIKSYLLGNKQIFAIVDTKFKNIQFFEDNAVNAAKKLIQPDWIIRIALLDKKVDPFICHIVQDTLKYFIREHVENTGLFNTTYRSLTCESPSGVLFQIKTDAKKKKLLSFDGMAIIGDSLYVSDAETGSINVFHRTKGNFISSFASKGGNNGQLKSPKGLVSDTTGTLYICDQDNNRISIFDKYGVFSRSIVKPNVIVRPSQILLASNGNFFILCDQKAVIEWNPTDEKTVTLSTRSKIASIELTLNDLLTVVDDIGYSIYSYENNKEIKRFGTMSQKSDQPFFNKINAIAYNPREKTLYVSDTGNLKTWLIKYYLPPTLPLNVQIKPAPGLLKNDNQVAMLKWDDKNTVNRWVIYASAAGDTSFYTVKTNSLVITEPKAAIMTYQVAAVSEDNHFSPLSTPVTDEYSYAVNCADNGNYLMAINILKGMAKGNSEFNVNDAIGRFYYLAAQSTLNQWDYDSAILYFDQARQFCANPDTLIASVIKVYKMKKAWQGGIDYLLALPQTNDVIKREMLGLLYLVEDWNGTVQCATDLLNSNSEDPAVMNYLAMAHERQMKYSEALDAYSSLATTQPILSNQLKVAEMMLALKKYDEAISHLQKLLTQYMDQPSAEIQAMLGKAYIGKKLYGRAIDCYSNATQLENSQAEYFYQLGNAYQSDRKTMEAVQSYRKAFQLKEDDFNYGFELAKLYDKEGKLNEAIEVLDKIKSSAPTDSTAIQFHVFYGNVLLQRKRYDEAYREVGIALRIHPSNLLIQEKHKEITDARALYNQGREPIEITRIFFDPLYPSLGEYYKNHPVGYISLFNTRNVPINDVTLKVKVAEISDLGFERRIPSILAGEEAQIDIILETNSALYQLCESAGRDFVAEVSCEYTWDKQDKIKTDTRNINALALQSMNWKNRKQLASFVNPADAALRTYTLGCLNAMKVPEQTELPKSIVQAMEVYNWLSARGISYVNDPSMSNQNSSDIDYVQFPAQTLQVNQGDCDDLLVLYVSMLSTIGINTGYLDLPAHVIPVLNTGMTVEDIEKFGFDRSWFIIRYDTVWMPIEMTVISKENFYKSWMAALDQYKTAIDSGNLPDFFAFNEAHQTYPPATWTKTITPDFGSVSRQALALYQIDFKNITNAGQLAIEEDYLKTLTKYPDNLNVKNRFALWYMDNGKPDLAKKLWQEILVKKPNHMSALVNLANLSLIDKNYIQAREYYLRALPLNSNAKDNILLNLCILEYRAENLPQAKEYFSQIKDSSSLRRINPQIYVKLIE